MSAWRQVFEPAVVPAAPDDTSPSTQPQTPFSPSPATPDSLPSAAAAGGGGAGRPAAGGGDGGADVAQRQDAALALVASLLVGHSSRPALQGGRGGDLWVRLLLGLSEFG